MVEVWALSGFLETTAQDKSKRELPDSTVFATVMALLLEPTRGDAPMVCDSDPFAACEALCADIGSGAECECLDSDPAENKIVFPDRPTITQPETEKDAPVRWPLSGCGPLSVTKASANRQGEIVGGPNGKPLLAQVATSSSIVCERGSEGASQTRRTRATNKAGSETENVLVAVWPNDAIIAGRRPGLGHPDTDEVPSEFAKASAGFAGFVEPDTSLADPPVHTASHRFGMDTGFDRTPNEAKVVRPDQPIPEGRSSEPDTVVLKPAMVQDHPTTMTRNHPSSGAKNVAVAQAQSEAISDEHDAQQQQATSQARKESWRNALEVVHATADDASVSQPQKAGAKGVISNAGNSMRFGVIRQIARAFNKAQHLGTDEIRLRVEPKSLGEVWISISRSEQGVRADFKVTTEAVRSLLQQSQQDLAQNLERSGIKLTGMAVGMAFSERQNTDDGQQKRSKKPTLAPRIAEDLPDTAQGFRTIGRIRSAGLDAFA